MNKMANIYEQIDHCEKCILGCLPCNKPPRRRFKTGPSNVSVSILIISQNPGQRGTHENVWGDLNIFFKRYDMAKRIADRVWITNVVKCSTPKNDKPKTEEIRACEYWLNQEIKYIHPKKIIGLGNVAKKWLSKNVSDTPIITFYHPNFVFRFKHGQISEYLLKIWNELSQ
jgi:uracil-DNA glycosylase family 4